MTENRKPSTEFSLFRKQVKNFKQKQNFENAFEYLHRGLHEVPLEQIVGSVGKYKDFDNKFRLKHHLPQERLERMKELMRSGKSLPPVDLYQIKDEYYVLDGNHRVAAAKSFGFKKISARIVEFLPRKTSWEEILDRKRDEFHERTRLTQPIELTEVGQYNKLEQQIDFHRGFLERENNREVFFNEAAEDWYMTIYMPMINLIERNRMLRSFPERTAADLYAYISYYQWGCLGELESGQSTEELMMKNMEDYRMRMSEGGDTGYKEMMREITAFVMLDVTIKKGNQVIDKLFTFDEVKEVHSVHGNIDILVKIVLTRDLISSDAEVISRFVSEKIRHIPGITRSQTLIPGKSKVKKTDTI